MNLEKLMPINQKKLYGHENILINIFKLYNDKKLPNKILFCGPKGIGKSTLAYHLINYIFSKDEEYKYNFKDFAINDLNKSYNLINKGIHQNFHIIDVASGKKNIEISQVRKMINYTTKSTLNNRKKIISWSIKIKL